jgi:hypothetical protein
MNSLGRRLSVLADALLFVAVFALWIVAFCVRR